MLSAINFYSTMSSAIDSSRQAVSGSRPAKTAGISARAICEQFFVRLTLSWKSDAIS